MKVTNTISKFASVILCLALSLMPMLNAEAGPVYGVDFQKQAFHRTLMLMQNPDPYSHIPAGRTGGTIGLSVIPRLTADADDAERALGVLVGHIPSINMAITLPNNDIMYLFKFLKHLKANGKKVDVLLIGGHSLAADPDNPEPLAINLKASGVIDTANFNVGLLQRRIEMLAAEGKNPRKVQEYCEQLKLIRDGSSALVPGAQVLLHSCYLGSKNGENLTKIIGTSLLGVNGGLIYGPQKEIGHTILAFNSDPNDDPKTVKAKIYALLHERSIQICQSLKSKTWISPGEAFINTNLFFHTKIPGGILQIPCQCDQTRTAGVGTLLRKAPEIKEEIPGGDVKFQVNENSITATRTSAGQNYTTTVTFTPPPPVITQKQPFTISGSLSGEGKFNSPRCAVFKGAAFDMNDSFFITETDTSDKVELVTWTNPSERQRREMFVGIKFTIGSANITETWRYDLQSPVASASSQSASSANPGSGSATAPPAKPLAVVGMQSRVVSTPTKTTKSPNQAPRKTSSIAFRRTGPFVTQKKLIPSTTVQLNIGESEVTYSGKELANNEDVSCTLKFSSPPEDIAVGDNFMLSASLTGHEAVSPIAGFLVGGGIKPAVDKDKNIGLGRDFCVPSNSSTYNVVDHAAEFDKFAKANPAQAAQFAHLRNREPSVKMHASGPIELFIEWRYVRK